jgi:hypothetical protein
MFTLCSLSPGVPMVQPAQAWQRSHSGMADCPWLDRTSAGRVFAQRVVDAVLLVIADVLADDAAQVFFIDRNDIVEDLAATASNPVWSKNGYWRREFMMDVPHAREQMGPAVGLRHRAGS